MFIGRGFDINNDGSNDIFVGGMLTDAQKRANQEIGGLILGLGCFGIAIYAVLAAFVGICTPHHMYTTPHRALTHH